VPRNQRCTLFVFEAKTATSHAGEKTISAFDNPDKRKDSKNQGRPMNESRGPLLGKDGKERPADGN